MSRPDRETQHRSPDGRSPGDRPPRIYLAGPDVFFADAAAHFDALEARCAALGLRGFRPSDGGLSQGLGGSGDTIAERIYQGNVELLRDCDAVLANLMPFRNAIEPDSGTVFEVGMAVALGRPVAGIVPGIAEPLETRVARHCGVRLDAAGQGWCRSHGYLIESFGQPLNLMLSRSVALFGDEAQALAWLARRLAAGPGG